MFLSPHGVVKGVDVPFLFASEEFPLVFALVFALEFELGTLVKEGFLSECQYVVEVGRIISARAYVVGKDHDCGCLYTVQH